MSESPVSFVVSEEQQAVALEAMRHIPRAMPGLVLLRAAERCTSTPMDLRPEPFGQGTARPLAGNPQPAFRRQPRGIE